jgi:MFS family permease
VTSRFNGLWRNRDFVRLWTGQTVSVFGSLTTRVALPFTAIVYLDARAYQVALITAADVLAGILFGLIAGVWVDRLRRKPIMMAADAGRAALVGSIPIAALFGLLRVEQLYVIAFLAGTLTIFFDVAYQSYLPSLIRTEELVEGNSKLAASSSVAEFGAFSLAGWLVQLITAPGAIAVDAVSFVVSALSLRTIRTAEPEPAPAHERESLRAEVLDGLRAVLTDPILRALGASWVAMSLASGMFGSVFLLFTSRELGFSPGVLGVIFGVGGLTSLVGAVFADRCRRRFGAGGAMVMGLASGGIGVLVMTAAPASMPGVAAALLVAQQVISDPGWTIYEVNQVSLRQAVAPERVLGRVNAGIRFAGLVAMLAGSLIAAVVADVYGARPVLVMGGLATLAGAAWLLLSPVRDLRGGPTVEEVAPAPVS